MPLEEPLGVSPQFEKPHTLLKVGLVGRLVAFDLTHTAGLLGPPFRRHTIKKGDVHPPVELVDIHRVDAVLESAVFGLQAGDRSLVLALLGGVTMAQRLTHPVKHFIVKAQPTEQVGELLFEHFLADVGLLAFPLVAGAMVVNISLLLDLADHRTAAVAACDQARKREIVLGPAVLLGVASVENPLHPLPKLAGDERLVLALVDATFPLELAHVKAGTQDSVDSADGHRIATLTERHPISTRLSSDLSEGQGTGRIPLEQLLNHRSQLRIRLDDLFATGTHDVSVAEGRIGRPDALLGLFKHPLTRLLRQIVDVVLCHQHLDAVHELLGGARFARQDDTFLDQVNFDLEFVDRHPVLEVAVEPIGLLNKQHADGRFCPQTSDHLAEASAAGLLGCLDIHILLRNREALRGGVVPKQLELRRDREALLLLLLGRDPGIDDRFPGAGADRGRAGFACHGV